MYQPPWAIRTGASWHLHWDFFFLVSSINICCWNSQPLLHMDSKRNAFHTVCHEPAGVYLLLLCNSPCCLGRLLLPFHLAVLHFWSFCLLESHLLSQLFLWIAIPKLGIQLQMKPLPVLCEIKMWCSMCCKATSGISVQLSLFFATNDFVEQPIFHLTRYSIF